MADFQILEDGVIQDHVPAKTWSLWHFTILLISVFFSMTLASFIICLVNKECREAVPTVHVLLTSPITGPFAVMGLSAGTYVFFITCFALYHKTNNRMLSVTTIGVYVSLGCIFIVFPFTGWANNWGIFVFIVAFFLWMCNVSFAMRFTYRVVLRRFEVATIVVYTLSSLVYMGLQIAQATVKGVRLDLSVGMLVVQVTGTIAIVVYMFICLVYVRSVKITVHPH